MIIMDSKQQITVDIISKVTEGRMSICSAMQLLQKSRRTIERYLQQYKVQGLKFILHGNSGKAPINKLSTKLKSQVQTLIKEKYYDVNLQHLSELLEQRENIYIKRETLRQWAHEIHHVKRAKRRRSKVRKKRDRMASSGLMLQMDGSTHRWFGGIKTCLIALIDDATSELHGEFFPSETTYGCLKVLKDFIQNNGLFKVLYVDKAGIFGGPKRCNFSQMQRACDELGIEIIFAQSPQGKGRIERAFDTLQDRLVPELRLNGTNTLADANAYLKQKFIPEFWHKNIQIRPADTDTELRSVPDYIDLDTVCIQKEYRKIRLDHTFSFGNQMYLITSDLKHSIARQKIEIRKHGDGTFAAYFADRPLDIEPVTAPTKSSMYDLEIQKKIDVLELAKKHSIAKAARMTGVSRDTIYRHKRILKEQGPEGLRNKPIRKDIHHKNRHAIDTEETVLSFSLENPHLGQAQVSAQMRKIYKLEISPSGIRNIWVRENLNTTVQRMHKAQEQRTEMA